MKRNITNDPQDRDVKKLKERVDKIEQDIEDIGTLPDTFDDVEFTAGPIITASATDVGIYSDSTLAQPLFQIESQRMKMHGSDAQMWFIPNAAEDWKRVVLNIPSAGIQTVETVTFPNFTCELVNNRYDQEIQGVKKFQMGITANSISEYTADDGVTIDGVLLKDGLVDGIDVSDVESRLATSESDITTLDTTTVKNTGDETVAGHKTLQDGVTVQATVVPSMARSDLMTLKDEDGVDRWIVSVRDAEGSRRLQFGAASGNYSAMVLESNGTLNLSADLVAGGRRLSTWVTNSYNDGLRIDGLEAIDADTRLTVLETDTGLSALESRVEDLEEKAHMQITPRSVVATQVTPKTVMTGGDYALWTPGDTVIQGNWSVNPGDHRGLVVPESGLYKVTARATFTGTPNADYFAISVDGAGNGSGYIDAVENDTGNETKVQTDDIIALSGGGNLFVWLVHNEGSNLTYHNLRVTAHRIDLPV